MKKIYLQIILISISLFLIISVTAQESEQEQLYQTLTGSDTQEQPKFFGYIIQLKQDPLVIQRIELETKALENEKSLLNPLFKFSTFILPRGLEPTLPSNVQEKYEIQKGKIRKTKEKFKQNALQTLGKSQISNQIIGAPQENINELTVLGEYENVFNGIALDITTEEAELLNGLREVKEVSPNYLANITLMDSVPLINATEIWQLDANGNNCATSGLPCLTGQGITIGIIDTGVDYTHPDLGGCTQNEFLAGSCNKVVGGFDFVNNDNNPMDEWGHGTHVAATAAGNGILKGVAPDARIYAYNVCSVALGGCPWSAIIPAIERSVDPNQDGIFSDHLDVISISLGGLGGNPDDAISQAVDNAVDAGIVAIVSAGNHGSNSGTITSPGTARKAITVGASYKSDLIVRFSSRGPVVWPGGTITKPDVVAPGASICAAQWDNAFSLANTNCNLDNNHVAISGTSMATPHVSGAVALIKQAHPGWTPLNIKTVLQDTAIDIGENINTQGHGRINVLYAVKVNFSVSPPIAVLQTSGFIEDVTDIIGTAAGENFMGYKLYHGFRPPMLDNPIQWILLHSSSTPVTNGILFLGLNPESLPDGENILRLVVESTDGQLREDRNIIFVNNVELTFSGDVFIVGDTISMIGTAKGIGFQNYTIEYDIGNVWHTEGITLVNNGLSEVINGLLGTFDTFSLEPGQYAIRLTVNYEGRQEIEIRKIFINPITKEPPITDEGCRAYFTSCTCSYICTDIPPNEIIDCAKACAPFEQDNAKIPNCGVVNGICQDVGSYSTSSPLPKEQIKCSDDTPYDQCSITKPLYCDANGNLVNRCSLCGCPYYGGTCQIYGACSI